MNNQSAFFKIKQQNLTSFHIPCHEKIVVFSPHPDDDVLGMGAFLYYLAKKNIIDVYYMTSGYRGVRGNKSKEHKKNIREKEAIDSLKKVGISKNHIHFMNLNCYDLKMVKNKDIEKIENILKNSKSRYIFLCTDFSDPHNTHKICFNAFKKAASIIRHYNRLYLGYKSVWSKFRFKDIDYFFCFDDYFVNKKIDSIQSHISQLLSIENIKSSFLDKSIALNLYYYKLLSKNISSNIKGRCRYIEPFKVITEDIYE